MSTKDKSPVFTFGAILFVLGAILFGIKLYAEWNGVEVKGTVRSINERSVTDSTGKVTTYYEPRIAFHTEEGDTASGILLWNESPFCFEKGDSIRIVYRKSEPSHIFTVKSFWWYFPFAAVAMLGMYVMYVSTKLKSEGWDG